MKKKWVMSVIIAVMVSMTGCGGAASNSKGEEKKVDDKHNVSSKNVESTTEKKTKQKTNTEKKEQEDKDESEGFMLEHVSYESHQGKKYILKSTKTGLYGLFDSNGNTILPMEYDEMNFGTINNKTEIAFKTEGKWGVCNENGKEIIPAEYEELKICDEDYLIQQDGKQKILGIDGKIIKELQGKYERTIGSQYLVYSGDYWDINENQISNQNINYEKEKYIIYDWKKYEEGEDCYRLLDKDGNVIYEIHNNVNGKTPIENLEGIKVYNDYYMIQSILNDRYIVLADGVFGVNAPYRDGKYYLYDIIENKKIDTEYNQKIAKLNENEVIAERDEGLDVYDLKGKLVRTLDISGYDSIDIRNDILVAKYGESYRVYDKQGKEITGERYLEYDQEGQYLMVKNLEGKWGIINKNGDIVCDFGVMSDNYNYFGDIISKDEIDGKLYLLVEPEDNTLILWTLS